MTHDISILNYFFIDIRSIFKVQNYFKKLLNPLMNSIQTIAWFELHFLREKIYKNVIMY